MWAVGHLARTAKTMKLRRSLGPSRTSSSLSETVCREIVRAGRQAGRQTDRLLSLSSRAAICHECSTRGGESDQKDEGQKSRGLEF